MHALADTAVMNTQCPHCRTVFRLQPATLEVAGGRVRCGHCRRIFDARSRLQKELPLGPPPAAGPRADQPPLDLGEPIQPTVSGLLLSDLEEAPPARRRGTPSRRSIAGWSVVNLVLLAALCGQLLFIQRAAFAQNPSLRPLLAEVCALAGCSLEPRQAVERIELVRRNVYAHPNVEDALIIDARFVNTASFPQPYPTLTVSLGNLRGEPLIRRNFSPREYRPELDPHARMAPGSPVRVTLEVRDPGRDARTFELDFS